MHVQAIFDVDHYLGTVISVYYEKKREFMVFVSRKKNLGTIYKVKGVLKQNLFGIVKKRKRKGTALAVRADNFEGGIDTCPDMSGPGRGHRGRGSQLSFGGG